jgi:hypothetical protein
MALAETQQLRMLERLRSAGKQPLTLGELRAGGIDFPAVVISELELHGYAIERVYEHGRLIGVRLLETEAPDPPASRRRQRSRRPSRIASDSANEWRFQALNPRLGAPATASSLAGDGRRFRSPAGSPRLPRFRTVLSPTKPHS